MKIFVLLTGLAVGSFINAQVYRLAVEYKLKKLSFKVKNKNRSFCDFCGKKLQWYENIPVISFLIQIGRSRCCRKNLPLLYPVVEIVTGLLFLQISITKFQDPNNYQTVLAMVMVGFFVFSAVFDLKYMILPDFSTYILIFLAFLWQIINFNLVSLGSNIMIGLACYALFYFLHVMTNGKGMGFGDVKLAFVMGLLLGWPKVIIGIYMAFVVGAIVGVGLMIVLKKGRKTVIPFGPLMILGTMVTWIWGDVIWQYAIKVLY